MTPTSPIKAFFFRVIPLVLGLGSGLVLAEIGARAFLPAPIPWKSPFLRYEVDKECGYRFRPSQTGYILAGRATINRLGFRGEDWKTDRAAGVLRIALLGDSMVFGIGVNDDETFGARLERILNAQAPADKRYEVLNFGIPGYDTGHELEVLKHHVLQFKPDLVILNFYLNDLIYDKDYSAYSKLFKQEEEEMSTWKWRVRELLRRSCLLMTCFDLWQAKTDNPMTRLVDAYIDSRMVPPTGPGEDGWHFVSDSLKALQELSHSNGFRTALVILPLPQEVINSDIHAPYSDFLVEQSRSLGITPVEVLPDLRSSGRSTWELLIPYNYHFAEGGHRVVAESLARVVQHILHAKTDQSGELFP